MNPDYTTMTALFQTDTGVERRSFVVFCVSNEDGHLWPAGNYILPQTDTNEYIELVTGSNVPRVRRKRGHYE